MKRTNIVIDEKKVKEAKKAFEMDTTKDVVDFALTEILKMHHRKGVIGLKGKVKLDIDLDQSRKTR